MKTRAELLVRLESVCNLETGGWLVGVWCREEERKVKERALRVQRRQMRECHKCMGMNCRGVTDCVPPWGDSTSPIMLVGQSAHLDGIRTDVPFILGSGLFIDAALGLLSRTRCEVFFANSLACHPERNRPTKPQERLNCREWLRRTIEIVRPKLLVGLGNDAKESVQEIQAESEQVVADRVFYCRHPAALMRSASPDEIVNWIIKLADVMQRAWQ